MATRPAHAVSTTRAYAVRAVPERRVAAHVARMFPPRPRFLSEMVVKAGREKR